MSFGLNIEAHDVDGNPLWVEVVDGHTYNLSPMWRKALPGVLGEGSTSALDGWRCGDLIPHLEKALGDMLINTDSYRQLNPSNGWGDFAGFYGVFRRFIDLCRKHPSGVVKWNG